MSHWYIAKLVQALSLFHSASLHFRQENTEWTSYSFTSYGINSQLKVDIKNTVDAEVLDIAG